MDICRYVKIHMRYSLLLVRRVFLYNCLLLWYCEDAGRHASLLQLWLSMEHHEQVSINAPSHSEACFCFKLGIMCGAFTSQRRLP